MKVAILIAGYLRTIEKTSINLKNKIFSSFPKNTEIDTYIYKSRDEHEKDRYFNPKNTQNFDQIINSLKPKKILFGSNQFLDPNMSINNLKNYWLKFYKLFRLLKSKKKKYDLIIKLRADVVFKYKQKFDNPKIWANTITIPQKTLLDKKKLDNNNDMSISDIYAFGNFTLMDKYINFYKNIDNLVSRYGSNKIPETYLSYYLNDNNIPYSLAKIEHSILLSNCNVIAISGDSGAGKSTLANLLKRNYNNSFVLEGDRYHKWERENKKWDYVTHLDPKANYLAKMKDDILNLKIGKNIYQVDYDHKTGKFTDQKKIRSKKNIIVCGLHSIYRSNEKLYNLKIFMDTDPKLKKEWKIKRDLKVRKKNYINIINEIQKRKKDYLTFINPQKKKSDLIIKFYLNELNQICLNLFLNKKRKLNKVINVLRSYKIDFNYSHFDKNFMKIEFRKFKQIKSKVFNKVIPTKNDYYDYITLVIFNMNND